MKSQAYLHRPVTPALGGRERWTSGTCWPASVAEIASKLQGEDGHAARPGCFTSGVIGSSAVRKRAGEGIEGMAEVATFLKANGKSH